MPKLGPASMQALSEVHPLLQRVVMVVAETFNLKVLCGHRGQAEQHKKFIEGFTQVDWPHGKHNSLPSLAVDIVPYPVDWEDRARFVYLAGHIRQEAIRQGIEIRWGGDWNKNTELFDNKFDDLPHFEIVI